MSPRDVETFASTGHGGSLELAIDGSAGRRIEISCGEDQAIIRHGGDSRTFENRAGGPRWRPDPGHNWIPEAVALVMKTVGGWSSEPKSG